jgi:hypothetical protein
MVAYNLKGEEIITVCRCAFRKNKPFCDGSYNLHIVWIELYSVWEMIKSVFIPGNYFIMRQKFLLILILGLLISKNSISQNHITGTWEGKFIENVGDLGMPKLVVEIFDFNDSLFTGITHLYYEGNQYEHYRMTGRFLKKDSLLVFKEVITIAVDLGDYSNCLGTYFTKLKRNGKSLLLDGFWKPTIKGCTTNSKVWLQKKITEIKTEPKPEKKTVPVKKSIVTNQPVSEKIPEKKSTGVVTTPQVPAKKTIPAIKTVPAIMPAVLRQRETDVQSLIEIASADKDSIRVDVYDNGEIDGDSVSVYEEGVQRINKKGIGVKPITFYVSLNRKENPIVHLRLVAENLGTIPPCTALMIVTTKSKRYEVRLSSNFNKNATVELFLKE